MIESFVRDCSVLLRGIDFNVFFLFIHSSVRLLSKGVVISKSQSLGRTILMAGQLRVVCNDKNQTKLKLEGS